MKKSTYERVAAGLLGAAVMGASLATAAPAQADKQLTCRMKGTWVEARDDFEFDAVYTVKEGADVFTGRYTNPNAGARADIRGTATNGNWRVLLTYLDSRHQNMVKELIGKGSKDRKTNGLTIQGSYRTLIGNNDIHQNGKFVLTGVCK